MQVKETKQKSVQQESSEEEETSLEEEEEEEVETKIKKPQFKTVPAPVEVIVGETFRLAFAVVEGILKECSSRVWLCSKLNNENAIISLCAIF